MEDLQQEHEIDTVLLPNMLEMNVKEALEKAASLCVEMRESADLCKRLLDRLRFLRKYLPTRKSKLPSAADYPKSHSVKTLLQRIAANRLIIKQIERLHERIDGVFRAANLSNSTEMNEWKEHKVNDIAQLQRTLEESSRNTNNLVGGLSGSALEEVLTELQSEIDPLKNQYEFRVFLKRVLDTVVKHVPSTQVPDISVWYIRRDDIEVGEEIDIDAFGAVHRGKWGDGGTEVVMKLLYLDGPDTQKSFLREADVWYKLNHPYVIKMLGGCHVGKPLFFVVERANYGNFADYLYCAENKSKLWRLFHQAAQGLAYLHGQRIVHSDIKCNNLLVGNDGYAKINDSARNRMRDRWNHSVTVKGRYQLVSTRWKAPECLIGHGRVTDPSFQSDVYSLGMNIIEAKIGGVSWGMMDDDCIIEQLADGEGYPRPDGVFSDKEWQLVQGMMIFEPAERMTLAHALDLLAEFASEKVYAGEEAEAEKQLSVEFDNKSVVTRRAGSMLGIRDEDLDRVSDSIEDLPLTGRDARGKLVHHIRQITQWTRLEQRERAIWEGAPQTNMCNECGDFNPRDSQFCCECGSFVDGYGSRYAEFRFVVPNSDGLEDAIKVFEELQQKAKEEMQRQQPEMCVKCGGLNPPRNRYCGGCGVRLLDTLITNRAMNDALPNEISRLKTIMERSNDQALWLKLQELDPKTRVCGKCGDRNSDEDVFCRECGADIEIIRRNKL